jgi:multisubunit Na+/H+ antiporter MnhB subunit
MTPPARIGLLFLALAVIFLVAVFRDYRRSEGKPSPARRTWLRVAIIFAIVGLGLQFLHLLLGR